MLTAPKIMTGFGVRRCFFGGEYADGLGASPLAWKRHVVHKPAPRGQAGIGLGISTATHAQGGDKPKACRLAKRGSHTKLRCDWDGLQQLALAIGWRWWERAWSWTALDVQATLGKGSTNFPSAVLVVRLWTCDVELWRFGKVE